jgi:hypothetical protein
MEAIAAKAILRIRFGFVFCKHQPFDPTDFSGDYKSQDFCKDLDLLKPLGAYCGYGS